MNSKLRIPLCWKAELVAAAQRLAADPGFDDWVRAVEEYRKVNNAVPDPD